jgi:hypothetical protein
MITVDIHNSLLPVLASFTASGFIAGLLLGYGLCRFLVWFDGPDKSAFLTALEREELREQWEAENAP